MTEKSDEGTEKGSEKIVAVEGLDANRVNSFYKGVVKFNETGGNTVYNYNHNLQLALINQDKVELFEAFNNRDTVGFLTKIIDNLVAHSYAWGVCKIRGENGRFYDPEDKLCKDEYRDSTTFDVLVNNTCSWVDRFGNLEGFCVLLKQKYGVDIEGAMEEVNRSNMSKFTKKYTEAVRDHAINLESCGRYKGVQCEQVKGVNTWKDFYGKILKGCDFSPANITSFVGNLDKFFEDYKDMYINDEGTLMKKEHKELGTPVEGLDANRVNNFYRGVIKFNEVGGGTSSNYDHPLQVALIEEEKNEMFKAFNERDAVEFLDGIIDSLVTSAYAYERTWGGAWESEYKTTRRDIFEEVVNTSRWTDRFYSLEQFCVLLKEEYGVFVEAAMEEVNRSNMSKFVPCSDENPHPFHLSYLEAEGRYKGVHICQSMDYFVWKDMNGKIMKGPLFVQPDLKPYVGNLNKFFEDYKDMYITEEGKLVKKEEKVVGNVSECFMFINPYAQTLTTEEVEASLANGEFWKDLENQMVNQLFGSAVSKQDPEEEAVMDTLESLFGDLLKPAPKKEDPVKVKAKVDASVEFTQAELDTIFELCCMTYTEDSTSTSIINKLENFVSDQGKEGLCTGDQRFTAQDAEIGYVFTGHVMLTDAVEGE